MKQAELRAAMVARKSFVDPMYNLNQPTLPSPFDLSMMQFQSEHQPTTPEIPQEVESLPSWSWSTEGATPSYQDIPPFHSANMPWRLISSSNDVSTTSCFLPTAQPEGTLTPNSDIDSISTPLNYNIDPPLFDFSGVLDIVHSVNPSPLAILDSNKPFLDILNRDQSALLEENVRNPRVSTTPLGVSYKHVSKWNLLVD